METTINPEKVAIHNKNGKGLLRFNSSFQEFIQQVSQSTIKMEKGYYFVRRLDMSNIHNVAIHNKNGKGLLQLGEGE